MLLSLFHLIRSLKVIIQKYRKKMYRQLTYTLIAHKGRLAAKHYRKERIRQYGKERIREKS